MLRVAPDQWRSFPALRKILENKRLPDSYYGFGIIPQNRFERLDWVLDIAHLACECEADIRGAVGKPMEANDIRKDLDELRNELAGVISLIDDASRRVERITRAL
jgi:hypothetical protein